MLQIAVQTQCGGYTDPDCASLAASQLAGNVENILDKTLRQSLKDAWCASANRLYFPALCDHPSLVRTVWTLRSTDKMFNATVDFYGGGSGINPSVIEISTSESGIGCNMPVANFAYDKNKVGFTCGNVAISATLGQNDVYKWSGIVVLKGSTTYQFEGEQVQ